MAGYCMSVDNSPQELLVGFNNDQCFGHQVHSEVNALYNDLPTESAELRVLCGLYQEASSTFKRKHKQPCFFSSPFPSMMTYSEPIQVLERRAPQCGAGGALVANVHTSRIQLSD